MSRRKMSNVTLWMAYYIHTGEIEDYMCYEPSPKGAHKFMVDRIDPEFKYCPFCGEKIGDKGE